MIVHYDLHIHSCLSACADILLSPNNIFNMANLKGLTMISITDHNSLKQYPILDIVSQSYDILLIPGVEISTIEDVHVLIYFKSVKDALSFDEILESKSHKLSYDKVRYGEQIITDIDDQEEKTIEYLLSKPVEISIFELEKVLSTFEHITILAHLDRAKHSALSFLKDIKYDGVELTAHKDHSVMIEKYQLNQTPILYNSDAHQLTDILEKTKKNQLELESLSIEAFFKYFKHG
jgi:3',5'-nucleoside bisphosphate phosphatase